METPQQISEVVDAKRKTVAKSRVKPRHLSAILRQAIVDEFGAVQSSEDVAEALGIPVRTVVDILLLNLRKPIGSERALFGVRRSA